MLSLEFKRQCGDDLYAEVLAIVGILYFYDAQKGFTGNPDVGRILDAFRISDCSDIVKANVEGLYKLASSR